VSECPQFRSLRISSPCFAQSTYSHETSWCEAGRLPVHVGPCEQPPKCSACARYPLTPMAGCRQCHRAGHIGPESNWLFLQNGEAMATSRNRRTGLGVATGTYIYFHCVTATNAGSRTPTERSSLAEFANYSRAFTWRFKPKASGLNRRSAYSRSCARFSGCRSRKICPAISYSSRSRVFGVPHSLFRRYKCRYK